MTDNNSIINQGKTIADLLPLNNVDDSASFAIQLAGQTYKITYSQLINKLKSDFNFGYYDDIGVIYPSERVDTPLGCVNYCNGGEYTAIDVQYPDFYKKLVNKHIHSITYDKYNEIIEETKTIEGSNGVGWCPFLAFDDDNKRFRVPKLSGDLVYLAFGVNRNKYDDGMPDILAEFTGGGASGAIESGAVTRKQVNSATYNNSGTAAFQDYLWQAKMSNSIFGKTKHIQPKTNQLYAYIVVSNTRFVQSDSSASAVALNKEIIDRQQADIDLGEQINGLVDLINGANSAYYRNSYAELVEFVINNKMILKVGNILICGGLESGEQIREFIWSGEAMVEKELTINIEGYVKKTEFEAKMELKLDKVEGWGLTENNFTSEEKVKLSETVSKSELDVAISSFEDLINQKVDKTEVIPEINETRNSDTLVTSEQAVYNYLGTKLSKKMDKVDSFIENNNINLLVVGNDITGCALDLASFNAMEVESDYEIKFLNQSVSLNNNLLTLTQRLKFIKANNSLVYFDRVGTNLEQATYLVKNNVIVAPNILGGRFWKLKSSQIGDASSPLIVSEIPFQLKYVLEPLEWGDKPDYMYTTFEDFDVDFYSSFEKAETLNNKIIQIEESDYNFTLEKTSYDDTINNNLVYKTFYDEEEMRTEFATLTLAEKKDYSYKNILLTEPKIDRLQVDVQLYQGVPPETPDYHFETYDDLMGTIKQMITIDQINKDYIALVISTQQYYVVSPLSTPIAYVVVLDPIAANYTCISSPIAKPSCAIGIYSEITAKEIMTRLAALESTGIEGQTRDFKELHADIWEITDVQIVNGGTGYIVGDRIKVLYNNITGNDIRGELKVNEINQDTGEVTSLLITHKGYYLQDITNTDLETRNKDNPNGNGLILSITSQLREGLTLMDYVPTEYNTYSTVTLDETHSYLTTQYIWQENAEHTGGEWVFLKEMPEDCRDLLVDKVVLGNETSGTLPKTQGGFDQDVSNIFLPSDREKILGVGTDGKAKIVDFQVSIENIQNFDLLQYKDDKFVNTNTINNLTKLGINTEANDENKLAVKSESILFDTSLNDVRYKINKADEDATASYIFQSNYSGRAEFGLVGDNNFTLKTSPNGEDWIQSFVVDHTTGSIDFKGNVTKNGVEIGAAPFEVVEELPENPLPDKMYFVNYSDETV